MSESPPSIACLPTCLAQLRRMFTEVNPHIEATITTAPPLVKNAYTMPPLKCPHGVLFWMEPTSDQIAEWIRNKTP